MNEMPEKTFLPLAALVSSAMLWGGGFYLTKLGMADAGAFGFVTLRFGVAAVFMLLLVKRFWCQLTRYEIWGGCLIGLIATLASGGIALALETESSSRVAFLISTYVLMVPLGQFVVFRERPGIGVIVGGAFALIGVSVLSGTFSGRGFSLSFGDFFAIAAAFGLSLQIIGLSIVMRRSDARRLSVVVLGVSALSALIIAVFRHEPLPTPTPQLLSIVLLFGVMCAYLQFAMGWAQSKVPASKAAIIYATEPVFAGLIGFLAGEALGLSDVAGGGLILLGALIASVRIRSKSEKRAAVRFQVRRQKVSEGPPRVCCPFQRRYKSSKTPLNINPRSLERTST